MDVILLERIEKLGQMGDVVSVKNGFARNFLLPREKALRATKENLTYFDSQRKELETRNLQRRDEAGAVAQEMAGTSVVLIRQAGETGQLYGSVTIRDIAVALDEEGYKTERSQVALDRPIKTIGVHEVRIYLHAEVAQTVSVNVARSEQEAQLQAQGVNIFDEEDEEQDEIEMAGDTEASQDAEESGEDAAAVVGDSPADEAEETLAEEENKT